MEELVAQCQFEFQTDRHKVCFLWEAAVEFSNWSLCPVENINLQKYSFNRLAATMHVSIDAKGKVKMLPCKATEHSVSAHNHRRQYLPNPRYVRHEMMALSSKRRTLCNFHKARRLGICFQCLAKR